MNNIKIVYKIMAKEKKLIPEFYEIPAKDCTITSKIFDFNPQ